MYLVIKELSGIAEDVIMVTQSLIKDIQSKQDTVYRANAIRALCLITDVSVCCSTNQADVLIAAL
jgi:coatomer protein complex subunit gamma